MHAACLSSRSCGSAAGQDHTADVGAAADSPTVTHSICDRCRCKSEHELQADGAVSAIAGIFGKIYMAERGGAELPTHRHRRGGMQRLHARL